MFACCQGCCNPCSYSAFQPPEWQATKSCTVQDYSQSQYKTPPFGRDKESPPCNSTCRRNHHIVEALCFLFKCPTYYMLSTLFKLAHQQSHPQKLYPRDRVWDVMLNVKAPYTELNDLDIYDSMYDRCGDPIDPLDCNNILKIVRMMFLTSVLTPDQHQYLIKLLRLLNERAIYRVNLDRLLETLKSVTLKEVVCSILARDRLSAAFHNARLCKELCNLYQLVTTTNKNSIIRQRKENRIKKLARAGGVELRKPDQKRKILGTQQPYCVRRPVEVEIDSPPAVEISKAPPTRSKNTPAKKAAKKSKPSSRAGSKKKIRIQSFQQPIILDTRPSDRSEQRRSSYTSRSSGSSNRRMRSIYITGKGVRMQGGQ